jgi:hypothetical protein
MHPEDKWLRRQHRPASVREAAAEAAFSKLTRNENQTEAHFAQSALDAMRAGIAFSPQLAL